MDGQDQIPVIVEEGSGDEEQGDMMNMDRTLEEGRSSGYSIMDSADGGLKKRRFTHYSIHQSVNQSLRKLRSASMSVSMLAKPSDDRKASAFLAGWNVSNLIQGTGILGVPYAIRLGGWAGVVACFVIAFLCCHTGKLLVSCMYETSKKTGIKRRLRVNYPEVAEAVWKRHGFTIVSIVQCVEMFGGVVMYVVMLGTVWNDMFKNLLPGLGMPEWAAINCLIALPTLFITRMSVVSWLSMFSVFSLLSCLITIIAFCFTQIPVWEVSNIPAFNPQTFPVGFGIIVFSYCAHAVFPSIEGSMKKPEQFNGMMNASFGLAAVIKAALGAFMVLTFGIHQEQVCTVNLHDHPVWSRLATALVISNVLLAVPLCMFVVAVSFDDAFMKYFPHLNRDTKYHWVWLLMTRPLLLCLALLVALIVPHFGLLMGLVGSFTGTCLCFLFPCYFHMKLRWNSLSYFAIASDIAIMIFGVIAGTSGLIFSGKELVEAFMGKEG